MRDLPEDTVGGLRGESQQLDLVRVLDDPQVAQDERCRHEDRAVEHGLEAQEMERPETIRDGHPNRRNGQSHM